LSTRALWQPPVLPGGLVSRDISGGSRRMGKGNENLVSVLLGLQVKSYGMGPPALLPIQRKVCCRFLSPLKIHHLGEPAAFGSSGKHTNHYTTEAIVLYILSAYIEMHVFIFAIKKKNRSKFAL
jgi:hypothetical protein